MFWLITQALIAVLSFSGSLATKHAPLNYEPCMNRPTIIDLNRIECNYYPIMIILDKCNGSCNVVDDLSPKICVLSKKRHKC